MYFVYESLYFNNPPSKYISVIIKYIYNPPKQNTKYYFCPV